VLELDFWADNFFVLSQHDLSARQSLMLMSSILDQLATSGIYIYKYWSYISYSGCGRMVQGGEHKVLRLVLQCTIGVSSNPVEARMLDISISDWRALKSCWERTKKLSAQKSNSNTIELNISHYIYSERYSHKQDIKYTMIQIYCLLSIYGNIIIGNTYIKTVVYLWCIENVNISRQYMM
jgi:hypothetical protein